MRAIKKLFLWGSICTACGIPLYAFALPLAPFNSATFPIVSSENKAQQLYNQGLKSFAENKLDDADKNFQLAFEQDNHFASALLGRAEIAQTRRHLDEAGKFIKQAATLEPKNAYVQASLGRYLIQSNQLEDGARALQTAANLDPKMIRPRIDLADLFVSTFKKPELAIPLYRDVIALDPDNGGAYYGLGNAQAAVGHTVEAVAALKHASELAPANPLPAIALSQNYVASGKLHEAEEEAQHALKLQPGLAAAQLQLATVIEISGRYEDALVQYKRLASNYPKLPLAHFKVGALLQRSQHLAEATEAYNRALGLDKNFAPALNNLANISLEQKDVSKAESLARRAVQADPKVGAYHDTLSSVYEGGGKLNEALQEEVLANTAEPKNPAYIARIGMLYAKKGDKAQARTRLTQAFELSKKFDGSDQAMALLKTL